MKQTGVKEYRRTAAMLAATFTALLAVSSFSFVQAEENTEISFPAFGRNTLCGYAERPAGP